MDRRSLEDAAGVARVAGTRDPWWKLMAYSSWMVLCMRTAVMCW